MDLLFSEIEYFIMVAECLNFTTASSRLFISQPGLSKVISRLESKLGIQLFERSTRKVAITKAGEFFYSISKKYITQCRALAEQSISTAETGKLTICFANFVDLNHMPSYMKLFQVKHPFIRVCSFVLNAEELLSDIDLMKVDIGVISSYAITGRSYRSLLIAKYPLRVILWKDHPLAKFKKIRMRDLMNEQFVFLERSINRGCDTLIELCKNAGFTPNIVDMEPDFQLMFLQVSQKRGITFNLTLPDIEKYPEIRAVNVDMTEFPEYAKNAGLSLVWSDMSTNPALKAFLNIVEQIKLANSHP